MKNSNGANGSWKENLLNYLASDLGLELDGSISLPRAFFRAAQQFPSKPALLEKQEGEFRGPTFGELKAKVVAFALGLIRLGLPLQGKVALFLKNSPDWAVVDLGTLAAGGVSVPIFDTLSSGAIRHILNNSEATYLVVEDQKFFEKLTPLRAELAHLKGVFARIPWADMESDHVVSLQEFLAQNEPRSGALPSEVQDRLQELRRDDLASIVYTSGTTGEPKGVMLTQRNFLSNVYGILSVTGVNSRDTFLSILPLAHTFERTLGYYAPLLCGATIAYSEGAEKLLQNLSEVRPTVCCAVPRIFEKIYTKMLNDLQTASPMRRRIFDWAVSTGARVQKKKIETQATISADQRLRHRPEDLHHNGFSLMRHPSLFVSHRLADALVYRKIKNKLGGRLRYFVSGGAPLNPRINDFFHQLDVEIYEGYGLTETSPIISFNYQNKNKAGTVGKLLPSVQLRFSDAGEICVKGPNVMQGYYQNPQATAEVLDAQGWFHTGDVGQWDENHFLKITDRIKELIVLSTGKKVPPLVIENKLTLSPLVAHSIVLGNNEKFISALLFPNPAELQKIAQQQGLQQSDFGRLCQEPVVQEKFSELIKSINQDLSHYEKIKRYTLIPMDLTSDPELLTPTLKIKRRVVDRKFKDQIAAMYQKEEE